ncbi:hypothetical protein DM02DRAFT_614090 [Periconia macrospinosa]|uniref:Uncharacterized protein n=1 Tax=Periconia macrospinosa TaxID=97972 RepID=A0A2V1DVJ3_9PLEO|nr:hypothetical protein DM02DRAFT_614090 [Periconia macrospinosa]
MARKNKAAAVVNPPKERSDDSDDAAEKQLFEEFEASSARKAQPQPDPSAVRNANLLNDARRSTAPDPKKGGDGKLRRPNFMRMDLAKLSREKIARSNDIYDFPAGSPEKDTQDSPFKLPTTVNKKTLKRVKKGKQPVRANGEQAAVRKQAVLPEDKPKEDKPKEENPKKDKPKKAKVAARVPEVDVIIPSSHSDPLEAPSSPPPTLPILEDSNHQTTLPLRKSKRKPNDQASNPVRSAKSPRRDVEISTQKRKSHPKVVIPVSKSRKLTPLTKPSQAKPASKSTSGTREDDISGNPTVQEPTTQTLPKTKALHTSSAQNHSIRRRGRPPSSGRPASTNGTNDVSSISKNTVTTQKNTQGREGDTAETSSEQIQQQEEELESNHEVSEEESERNDDAPEESAAESDDDNLDALGRVFKFLDGERRSGDCVTEDGIDIARFCQAALDFNSNADLTLDDMILSANELETKLTACGAGKSREELKAIKIDAYAYLFRDLARYLEMSYDWLAETQGPVQESISSMRIIFLVVRAIIDFKDMIAHWKMPISDHDKGGRLVKDVDAKLIAPLRKVQKEYDFALDELEVDVNRKRMREKYEWQRLEKEHEMAQKQREAAMYQERWRRWQDLHTCRLKYEFDTILRRRLFIDQSLFDTLLEQSEERDANGQKFERLPVFRDRDSPPARRGSPHVNISWPEEHIEALVDGLQIHSGSDVFEDIFKAYCFPGGELQRYTVPEITAQAAWIRSELSERFRQNDWEIPAWIKQIPVLP